MLAILFWRRKMKFLNLFSKMTFLVSITTYAYNLDTSHPLIYEIPLDSEKGSYFGMSVVIRPKAASLTHDWSIQIGAPRGNIAGVGSREPGAVYRCHTYGPCWLFEVDRGLSPVGGLGIYEFKEKKDGAWTGVAMDIKNYGSYEETVVCGHRWINQNLKNSENIDVTYLMTGVCYIQHLSNDTSDTPVLRLLPLVNKEKIYTPKPYVVDLSTYHWGLGQAGLSVKFTEEPSSLVIGAPGVTHWIGSVIKYENDIDVTVGSFTRTELAKKNRYTYLGKILEGPKKKGKLQDKNPATSFQDLPEFFVEDQINFSAGYSVALGRFYKDKEQWCATGAPRSANYRGSLTRDSNFQGSSGNVRIESILVGATFGEYFGSSLASVDINGDGFDDLIVGAPLFSNKDPDEGRIYVYLGTGRGYFLVSAQVIDGHVGQGRFGSCITSIQDLDQDGYGDVAVGAPYEDNKRGAVYIYRGFANGLLADFSQRIGAQDIHPQLRGFGSSISPAVDMDGNNYLDIAVGSHLSDHVVLIRSRPVIALHPQIKVENISFIDRKDSYVNVTVCSRYSGSNAPFFVVIWSTIEVDPVYGRGTLARSKNSFIKKAVRLRRNEIICDINTISLNLSGKNFSPLQITLKNEIDSCDDKKNTLLIKRKKLDESDGFVKMCPIRNKAETSKEIPFAGICGPDLICRSDLELTCDLPEFRTGSYILYSSNVLVLSMRVKNNGEPAHNTKIKIWSNLKVNRQDNGNENTSSRNTYWLPVEGVLSENYQTNFSFQIDLEALKENQEQTHINLMVEIFTSSFESNMKNNNCKLSAKLISDALISFHGSSSVSSIYITKEMIQNQTLSVTHYYEVRKLGITPVKDAELKIYIPFHLKKNFLSFNMETSEWMQLSDRYGNKSKSTFNESKSPDLFDEARKKVRPPADRILFLNCSMTAENDCIVLKIFFTKAIPTEFSSYVKVLLLINTTAIDLVKNEKDIIRVSTTGTLKIHKYLSKEPEEVERSVSVSLYSEERDSRVDARIVGLSVLAGGFLLSLIVTGLIKSNFFVRAKKEELKALKDVNASFVYFETGQFIIGTTSEESASAATVATATGAEC